MDKLFEEGHFPEGEIMEHPRDFNTFRVRGVHSSSEVVRQKTVRLYRERRKRCREAQGGYPTLDPALGYLLSLLKQASTNFVLSKKKRD